MKKINVLLVFILAITVTVFNIINVDAVTRKTKNIQEYRKAAEKIEGEYGLKVNDSSEITYKIITNRKNKVIVERCIGKVINKRKDGKILNAGKESGTYISYKGIKCKKEDIVISYFLWNPENNACDDIIARWDFVIN